MRKSINFDDILKNSFIETYFQPIATLENGVVTGYEALSRGPRDTEYYMPTALIAEAKSRNRMDELDLLFRKMALVNASKKELRKTLFINIDPVSLYSDSPTEQIVRHCEDFGISPHRVAVEVSERSALCPFEKFQKVMNDYKSEGFLVACDDINCAFQNINSLSSLDPDFIKIDGRFVRNIDKNTDPQRIAELESVISISKMIGAKIIAVGVESWGELKTLYHMGVDAVQGNLIGIPNNEINGISQRAAKIISDLHITDAL